MKAATIRIQVLSDSIGSEWNDINAAGVAYAEFLEARLAAALQEAGFATDDITVTYHANLAGYASDSVWSEECDDQDALELVVSQVNQDAWDAFCCAETSRDL